MESIKHGKRAEIKLHGCDVLVDKDGNALTISIEDSAIFDGATINQIWSHNDYEDWHAIWDI